MSPEDLAEERRLAAERARKRLGDATPAIERAQERRDPYHRRMPMWKPRPNAEQQRKRKK